MFEYIAKTRKWSCNFAGIETEWNLIRVDRLGVFTYNAYVQILMN